MSLNSDQITLPGFSSKGGGGIGMVVVNKKGRGYPPLIQTFCYSPDVEYIVPN